MTTPMTHADVDLIVSEARANATIPDLRGAVLSSADLRSADLRSADLRYADLRGADLSDADLRGANLRHANIWDADLRYADLRYADLRGADLRHANIWDADLRSANLRYASGASGAAMGVSGLPSGSSILYPTPDGWQLVVGCWQGTPDTLRTMIASDDGWPEATGAECARRRPSLLALLALCEDHIARHPDIITDLAARWTAER